MKKISIEGWIAIALGAVVVIVAVYQTFFKPL